MEQALTIVCKLQPTPEQAVKIDDLLKAFADACNYANEQVKPGITSKTTIQNLVYQDIRSQFGLSANQAVRVAARVGANRKAAKKKGNPVQRFAPTSADYDARIFDFREKDKTISLTLLEGREHIPVILANYQAGKLRGRKPTSAQLCKHRDGLFYIHIQLTDEAPDPIKSDEDLTGIRERTNQQPRNKTERRRSNSWAFYQLRLFLEYKAVKAGVELVAVPPTYTSQTCYVCNHIGLRTDKRFKCGDCGWHGDANLNGAINISKLGAVFVSQPVRGSDLDCEIQGYQKPPTSAVG